MLRIKSVEEAKQILSQVGKVYVVGLKRGTNPHWDKGIWRKFAVYVILDSELVRLNFDDCETPPPHWVKTHQTKGGNWKGGYFETNALGMDRVFEVVYSLSLWALGDGYALKYEFLSWLN